MFLWACLNSDCSKQILAWPALQEVQMQWFVFLISSSQSLFFSVNPFPQSDANEERVAQAVGEACIRLHLADEQVCRDIIELFRDDFIRALQESFLWPTEACAILVGPSCGKFDVYAPWNITLPNVPKPPVKPPSPPKPGSPQSRVLFLTDVHWDRVSVWNEKSQNWNWSEILANLAILVLILCMYVVPQSVSVSRCVWNLFILRSYVC